MFRFMFAICILLTVVLLSLFVWALVGPPDGGAAMFLLLAFIAGGASVAGLALRRSGNHLASLLILAPVAWLGGGYGLLLLVMILLQPSFR